MPVAVRAGIEDRLGARVRSASTQPGGFSRGMASRLELADGRTVFAKAIPTEEQFAYRYRIEADTAACLSPQVPAPALQFTLETDGWLVLVFEDIQGRHPEFDRPTELTAVLDVLENLARTLTPSPLPEVPTLSAEYGPKLSSWRALATGGPAGDMDGWVRRNLDRLAALESQWEPAAVGGSLLHTDLRADNMLLRPDGTVIVVDWSWPCVGASWADLVFLAPALALQGVDPEPILASHPVTRDVDPHAITAVVCALAGYWTRESRRPGNSQSPALRRHRVESGRATIAWLQRRVCWE
ncbi:phosphotransferase family protein [Nocardia sp. NBC_00416]|uniref:phosphotransferase family protein n=1 Tax=Nocardia sp. NBC_00416 TaxID=2975991 RepID=UPI002E1DB503